MQDAGQTEARLDWPRRGLSRRSRRVCVAVTEALLSDEDEAGTIVPASPALCERTVGAFDQAVGNSSGDLRRGFAVLTFVIEILPPLLIGSFSRMSRLPIARRVAYLEALEASPFGLFAMLFVAFKVPLCIPAFEEGEELASTGFDRPSTVSRRRLPALPGPRGAATAAPGHDNDGARRGTAAS